MAYNENLLREGISRISKYTDTFRSETNEKMNLVSMKTEVEGHILRANNALNPLNPELNPICYLLALLAHHFLHISRIMVKSLTLRLLMSYIYGAHILDVSRSHTTHHSQ